MCCLKAKYEALKEEYATFGRILRETEDSLQRVNVEKTQCTNELNEVQRDLAAQRREKLRLEDEIMEKIRTQLTADKAAKYSGKIILRLRERSKDLETQVCHFQNKCCYVTGRKISCCHAQNRHWKFVNTILWNAARMQ